MHRILPMALLLASLVACDASRFSTAKRQDTIQAYRQYLALKPGSEHAPAARLRLEALEYKRARTADSVLGYRMFLERFPQGRYANDCRGRMASKAMARARTPADLQLILEQYPESDEATTARERLPAALAQQVLAGGDGAAMLAFLERFPGHPSGGKIRSALATARWARLNKEDRLALESFARHMVGTPEARQARQQARTLLELEVAARGTLALLRELQSRYPRSSRMKELVAIVEKRAAAQALVTLDLKTLKKRPAIRLGGVEMSRVIAQCEVRPGACQALVAQARAARPWRPVGRIRTMRAAVYGEDLLSAWRGVEALGWAPDEASANLLLELAGTTRISMVRLASQSLARWISRGPSERTNRWVQARLRHKPNRGNLDEEQRHALLRLLASQGQGAADLRRLMATPDRTLCAGFLLATRAGAGTIPSTHLEQFSQAADARLKTLVESFPSQLNKESAVAATLAERELFSLTQVLTEAAGAGNTSLAMLQARGADTLANWQSRLSGELDGFIPATDPDLSADVKRHEKGRGQALGQLRRKRDPATRAMFAAICHLHPGPGCPKK